MLVFIRHLYYLDVFYLNGDPRLSFEVDPDHLKTPHDWRTFLERKRIAYLVRSPRYPGAFEAPLEAMERSGDLIPLAQTEVQNFQGKRIDQRVVTLPVVILQVKSPTAASDQYPRPLAQRPQ